MKLIFLKKKHDRIIKSKKNVNLEKLFREKLLSPLLKTQEKDFQKRCLNEKDHVKKIKNLENLIPKVNYFSQNSM